MTYKLYLDDYRIPIPKDWIHVRDYDEFIAAVENYGLENISNISLDHDLGVSAMEECNNNVFPNGILNYDNINEKTGYDCAKWIVDLSIDTKIPLPLINVHSANPVGSKNIMLLINNYNSFSGIPVQCSRYIIPYKIDEENIF